MSRAVPKRQRIRSGLSSGNVFVDLGFPPAEAAVMQMRALLAIAIEKRIRAERRSQADAAKRLLISEGRVCEMLASTGADLSLDTLLTLAGRAGLRRS